MIPSSPYSPSDILREIYDMNAYLKLICLTLGSPFSLHHVEENDYLITAMYIYTLTKTEPLNVKTFFSQLCIKKTFLFKTGSLLCLGAIFLSVLINCAFSLWNALPHFCSASNQNNFKVLFPLCFSQDLQYQNKLQSSLQNFQLANSSVGETRKQIHNWLWL